MNTFTANRTVEPNTGPGPDEQNGGSSPTPLVAILEAARLALGATVATVTRASGVGALVLHRLDPDLRFDRDRAHLVSRKLSQAAFDRNASVVDDPDGVCGLAAPVGFEGETWGAACFLFEHADVSSLEAKDRAALDLAVLALTAALERDAEEMRRASFEIDMSLLLDSVPSRIWLKDENGTVLGANAAAADWLGLQQADIIGRNIDELFTGDLLEAHRRDLDVLRSGEPTLGSIEKYGPGGTDERWAKVDIIPLEDPISGTGKVFTFASDVTELMLTEGQLRKANDELILEREKYSRLYRDTPAIMHSLNDQGDLIEVSNMWLKRFGFERDEVIGRKSSEFLTEESARRAREEVLPDFFQSGSCWNVPYEVVCKDGTIVEVELSAILDPGDGHSGKRSFAVTTDVTQRNRAKKTLENRNAELERANESLRQFAYIASHDLQEPLRKMQAFAGVVREAIRDGNEDELEYALDALTSAAARSRSLVSDLLQFSRASNQQLEMVPVSMTELVDEVLSSLSTAIEECSARIELDLDDEPVTADRSQLFQTVLNFVSNALKYRHPERTLEVFIKTVPADEDDTVWLKVSDNGIGFDPAFTQQIFEPFKRLHDFSEYPGTGIGLAICATAAGRHGWIIDVESEPGSGSTFSLKMPRSGGVS